MPSLKNMLNRGEGQCFHVNSRRDCFVEELLLRGILPSNESQRRLSLTEKYCAMERISANQDCSFIIIAIDAPSSEV